ncbi:LytTR family two component transcriptional regulator [Tumebacillus sp. BK434]|uniref:LytR/AlgR family response regulator transcription factor n=1 Tax=Tumebacillus sp. BK434 TaxID=2512169 RepID=UPI00104B80A5|nr:LytTR family DNA-binding domain-containing protein [Tumebacillus sp. BK434]TCP52579.1 LytTR family two component transcriptional regulator [Tumebacillus sp. BK434]
MSLKVVVADDDPKVRSELAAFLNENLMDVVAEAATGKQAKERVQSLRPDVLFLDIDMPDGDGLTASKQLRHVFPELCIVFITVSTDYGSQAYDVDATDYLIKPFREERLYKCLRKIEQTRMKDSMQQAETSRLGIKTNRGIELIDQNQIGFIAADSKASTIYLKEGPRKQIQVFETLKTLEERVNRSIFFRSHRSFLINLNHVKTISPSGQTYMVTFDGLPEVAYVSRNMITQFYKRINF